MATRTRVSQSSLYTARIRMSEPVWRFIVDTKNPTGQGRDQLQCKLDRLVRENPDAHERILVTNDEDIVDILRDWCAQMIAEAVLIRSEGEPIRATTMVKEANRTIATIDKHDARLMEAERVFYGKKARQK